MVNTFLPNLAEARRCLDILRASGASIGSLHTLGALHEGHARVIRTAAAENDHVVVSVYPNKAQLAPGTSYRYDLAKDTEFAFANGATHVIGPSEDEIYPADYRTFLDQGDAFRRLDGTVVPFLFRGMITMSVRWISFVRPNRTYWGLKDIGQTLLVKRALTDLFIDSVVREVPCVRYRSGVPISSRLFGLAPAALREIAQVYGALEAGRAAIAAGERQSAAVISTISAFLHAAPLEHFKECYIKIAEPLDFTEPDTVSLPLILHIVVTDGQINHFDGMLLRSEQDLYDGPPVVWIDEEWPAAVAGGR